MVRLLRQVLLAAGLLSAACSASVIRPVDEARLASRELFYYYDIDTSMSIPCSKSFKSKKAKLPPPPPSKSSKSKMPPPPKYPKGCKQPKGTKSPKGKGKGFLPTKTPTEPKTKAPVPNSKRQCITSASALSSVLTLLCFCFSQFQQCPQFLFQRPRQLPLSLLCQVLQRQFLLEAVSPQLLERPLIARHGMFVPHQSVATSEQLPVRQVERPLCKLLTLR